MTFSFLFSMEPRADTPLRNCTVAVCRSETTERSIVHGVSSIGHGHQHSDGSENRTEVVVLEGGEIDQNISLDDGLDANDFEPNEVDAGFNELVNSQDSLLPFYDSDHEINHELDAEIRDHLNGAAEQDLSEFEDLVFPKYGADIKLLDIPFEHLSPTLILLNKPIEFINSRYKPAIAQLFSKYIAHLLEDKSDPLRWKKLLLLPAVLFVDTFEKRLATLYDRIQKLRVDNWNTFTVGMFMTRKTGNPKRTTITTAWDLTVLRALKYIKLGEISRAMNTLTSTSCLSKATKSTLSTLARLHPYRQDSNDQIYVYDLSDDERNRLPKFKKIVKDAARGLAAPVNKMTYDHYRQLIGDDSLPYQHDFLRYCAEYHTLFVNGEVPNYVDRFLASPELPTNIHI